MKLLAGSAALLLVAACGDDGDATGGDLTPADAAAATDDAAPAIDAAPALDAPPAPSVTFTRHTVDDAADGPAYVAVADLDDDPALELVVSSLGKSGFPPVGSVAIYDRGADLDSWTRTVIDPGVGFPGQPTIVDVDGDDDLDVILPSGFLVCAIAGSPCGGLAWYEHDGATWTKHGLVSGSALFYHHVELADVDGDGRVDLVTTGEEQTFGGGASRAVVQWFAGTDDADRFAATPHVIGDGGGSFPRVLDVDGDGDLDVASAEFFVAGGSFAWFERTAAPGPDHPDGTWVRHAIDADSGPAIMLTPVPDLFGDGTLRYVGSNHTNTAKTPPDAWPSAVFALTPGADATAPWTKTAISTGIESRPGSMFSPMAAPGIVGVGDVDDDGDVDVLVSGDGDVHAYWLEQTVPGTFATHVLEASLGQAGGVTVVDLDGDGDHESIMTGYEDDAIYVYDHD
ncbi:MAG: VCBS repeat-containing protein [Kofleriaceae bacterium]|nr:VCBS repeat-containing protein [Kofleriaceae bacterium]